MIPIITPFVNQETERLVQHMEEQKLSKEDLIKEYLDKHDVTKYREGVDYYFKRNDIMSRKIYKYDNQGRKTIDHEATNNKMASGWHKLLVDQKTSYLVGKPITFNSKGNDDDVEKINEVLGDNFNDDMPEIAKNAANKGREWLHPYIDENGEFDYMIVPAEEGIPIYDNTKRKNLIGFIRKYELDDGTEKVELWDGEQVTYYEYHNGGLVLDMSHEENPQSHFYYNGEGYGWKYPPFVEFANNAERVSDLVFIKDFIDVYDKLTADASNTLEDIQQFLYVIRGYSDTDVSHAVTNLRRYKGVAVDEEGGVDIVQGDMPMGSLDSYLDRLGDNIFKFGGGLNLDNDTFGNSPSGVALRFLYSNLDMRADVAERHFSRAIQNFIWFVCEYISIAENRTINYKDITATFNKSAIHNEFEQIQGAQQSMGVVSRETVLENHPYVRDVQVEKERLEKEEADRVNLNDPVDGDE